jgi:GTP-binding protein
MSTIFLKSASKCTELPKSDKPHIALVGRSNVGKSSLLNHLIHQKGLAYESAQPGRTQFMNVFEVNHRFFLIDLPGYGFAKGSKMKREGFGDIVRDYLWEASQLKLVLLLVDARLGPTALDRDMIAYLESNQIPFVLIVNKIDKLSHSESIALFQRLEASHPSLLLIPHSTITNKGSGEIRQAIERAIR